MEQIKMFCKKANLPSALEAQVNDFLSENETKISVKRRHRQCSSCNT